MQSTSGQKNFLSLNNLLFLSKLYKCVWQTQGWTVAVSSSGFLKILCKSFHVITSFNVGWHYIFIQLVLQFFKCQFCSSAVLNVVLYAYCYILFFMHWLDLCVNRLVLQSLILKNLWWCLISTARPTYTSYFKHRRVFS